QGVVTDYTTGKPLPFLTIDVHRMLNSGLNVSDPSLRTDSAGRYTITNLPLYSSISLTVPCPDAPHGAAIQSFGVMPGMDTTINFPVDFDVCKPVVEAPPAPPPPSALSGAEAFIWQDSARFVFPLGRNIYYWDIPAKGAYPGYPQYVWGVQWDIPDSRAGTTPYMLWLIKEWQPGGPRSGPLEKLIADVRLEPMIECTTCDGAVFEDPKTDHSRVFATVESGQLVFVVHGAQAVRRIFPSVPATVTFTQHIQLPAPGASGSAGASQEVLVNCRNSNESAEAKRHCDMQY
ncbi:MAG TPA: carboxypeptidase-like regulatory domain-containing protein, partial [Gemmatimonadaceae bacterium]|nr:carboxypeptidase-like regulatory domain-containing protein [Gemmatimonadaceae bacterium]